MSKIRIQRYGILNTINRDFGQNLMVISKQKKRTQVALGKIIGTYGDVIGRYERGDITPSVDVVAKIADALEVSVDYLIYKTKLLIDKNILNRLEEFSNLLRIKNLKYSILSIYAFVNLNLKRLIRGYEFLYI